MNKRQHMKRVNFYLTQKQDQALSRIAKETGLTYSEVLRRAIDAYVKEMEKR